VPLAGATIRKLNANGKSRPGGVPRVGDRAQELDPRARRRRPYAADLTGWFEGFTHPGQIDANGNASRVAPVVGLGSLQNGLLSLLPAFLNAALRQPSRSDRATTGRADCSPLVRATAAGLPGTRRGLVPRERLPL